ncbi:hypothetical protein BaOVIS_008130 [Babesia ovis]|uniref:Clu domain-containing protein n=1 Tax=Babesia ovis TaxID=5869 RepID=A0A9W5TCZ6_BABOV|nr:hypothetical protein BaOVIS_008130 [Babesia ovis]
MDPTASRFADPLKDYGFDPASLAFGSNNAVIQLDESSQQMLNCLTELTGGLNLFPTELFDVESTPGSCRSRNLDWLRDFPANQPQESDPDVHQDVHPDELFDGADLQTRLRFYMYGNASHYEQSYGSWELPNSHPVRPSLKSPRDEGFNWNSNWYERLQWAYRSALPRNGNRGSIYVLGSDEEQEVLLELGRFSRSACLGATTLVTALLHHGMQASPTDFFEVTGSSAPLVQQFYHKKFPDDRQFINDGIVYTVVVGRINCDLGVTYTMAKKMYSNDQKGKQALCEALYSRGSYGSFAIPTQCIIDYLGIRVVAEPLIPLSTSPPIEMIGELLRDCRAPSGDAAIDISSSLLSHPELFESLKALSSYLHLCSLPIPFEASDISGFTCSISGTPTGLVCEGASANLQRCDNTLHIRQSHEVLPPILQGQSVSDPLFSMRFRPEFCFTFNGTLRSTVRSPALYADHHNDGQFEDAFRHLQVLLEDCVKGCNGLFDSWDLREVFHSFGVNMRYLGMAYECAVYSGLKNLLACDMVARAIKHLWDSQLHKCFNQGTLEYEYVMRRLFRMINDTFGLLPDASDFWSRKIIPEVARHFNLVNLEGISYRLLPHLLLKSCLELHLGILLPPPKNGKTYRSPISVADFNRIQLPKLLGKHKASHSNTTYEDFLFPPSSPSKRTPPSSQRCCSTLMNAIFPKVDTVRPQRELSVVQAASKLYKKLGTTTSSDLIPSTTTWDLGLCYQLESRLLGRGYPCDPSCVYSAHLCCVNYQHRLTGLNLFCLSETLLQLDPLKRAKLLLLMGYEYMHHRFYQEALECAEYVLHHTPPLGAKYLEARLLALQCHCLSGATNLSQQVYDIIKESISGFEDCEGLLSLQPYIFMAIDAWLQRDFEKAVDFATRARDAILSISGLPKYEWLPVAVTSLLGHCETALGRGVTAIKVQREAVRLCNMSHLPRYTLCNQTWLFVEYLLRNDSYEEGCPLSMELIPILEAEFGSLSVECLRGLYVSAWSNHQVGCGHLLHPLLYLSSADRVLDAHSQPHGIQGSLLLEEFVIADICSSRTQHRSDALDLYKSLYERLVVLTKRCRRDIASYIRTVYPHLETQSIQDIPRVNHDSISSVVPDINLSEDELLIGMVQDCERYQEKLLLVIRNLLSLKLLSLSSSQAMSVARRLYNAYVCQVSDDYVFNLCVGGQDVPPHSGKPSVSNTASHYGTRRYRQPERFSASISIRQNSVPHRGHELRSIEELLLKPPSLSIGAICEICRSNLDNKSGTPSEWFDQLFDLDTDASGFADNAFGLSLDVLRHLLTPSKRLVILGHVASISGVEVDITTTFRDLLSALEGAMIK